MSIFKNVFGKQKPKIYNNLLRDFIAIQDSGGVATHLLILFNNPGPNNQKGEVVGIMKYLKNKYNIKPLPDCTLRIVVTSIPDVADYSGVESLMNQWLDEDEEHEKFKILGQVSINAQHQKYGNAQATWVTTSEKWNADQSNLDEAAKQITSNFSSEIEDIFKQHMEGTE
jgi:hypothetical protein